MAQEEDVALGTRWRFTLEFEARVGIGLISGVKSPAEERREYQLKPQILA